MTEPMARPPSLLAYVEAGCDLTTIPDLENYAKTIVIGRCMPWQMRARLALGMDETAEAWLRGEHASLVEDCSEPPSFEGARKFLWLSEGLMEPATADAFEAALPEDIRAECHERIRELNDDLEAELGLLDD